MRWRTTTVVVLVILLVATVGCETIVKNLISRPEVQDVIDDVIGGKDKGEEPPGGGHGRGGSKDSTTGRDSTKGGKKP